MEKQIIHQVALLFLFAYLTNLTNCVISDIPCQPRPVIVSTQDGRSEYRPPNVELYRCSGSDDSSPKFYHCLKTSSSPVKVKLFNHGDFLTKTFENHTNCAMRCVCTINGFTCPDNKVYEPECSPGQIWDQNECLCITANANNGCKVDREKTVGISTTMFIVSLVVEFVAVLIIVFFVMDYFKYRKQSKGVIFKTSQYVKQISTGEKEGYRIGSVKRDREATGSVSFLHDVNNGNLPNGRIAV